MAVGVNVLFELPQELGKFARFVCGGHCVNEGFLFFTDRIQPGWQ